MSTQSYITEKEVEAFSKLFDNIELSSIGIADYPKTYLQHLLTHKKYFFKIYAIVLNEVLTNSIKGKDKIHLIDYGTGNGLLGLFAKFCGFKEVIAVDISEDFLQSTIILSKKINIQLNKIILGDIHTLFKQSIITPDAVIGTDVIEHIYDLNSFFSTLKRINPSLVTVFTTASNNKNWLKRRKLMKIQTIDDIHGWEKTPSNPGNSSFREMRIKIIKEALPYVSKEALEELATLTRGLNEKDILTVCNNYKNYSIKPKMISHPTNTCDPITGSWTERLLSFEEYKELYNINGFDIEIKPGLYNNHQKIIKSFLISIINFSIRTLPLWGFYISPLIILTGTPLKKTI